MSTPRVTVPSFRPDSDTPPPSNVVTCFNDSPSARETIPCFATVVTDVATTPPSPPSPAPPPAHSNREPFVLGEFLVVHAIRYVTPSVSTADVGTDYDLSTAFIRAIPDLADDLTTFVYRCEYAHDGGSSFVSFIGFVKFDDETGKIPTFTFFASKVVRMEVGVVRNYAMRTGATKVPLAYKRRHGSRRNGNGPLMILSRIDSATKGRERPLYPPVVLSELGGYEMERKDERLRLYRKRTVSASDYGTHVVGLDNRRFVIHVDHRHGRFKMTPTADRVDAGATPAKTTHMHRAMTLDSEGWEDVAIES